MNLHGGEEFLLEIIRARIAGLQSHYTRYFPAELIAETLEIVGSLNVITSDVEFRKVVLLTTMR